MKNIGAVPQLGFGTWNHLGDAAYNCVTAALEVGFRHLDCAEGYNNEEHVGRAIADSGVKRSELFITTKVAPEHFGPGQVMPHAKASLEKLRVDKVDLLLLHWPSIGDAFDVKDYVAQLGEVYDAGLATHIGVSNFTKKYLDAAIKILDGRPITTNQVEIHPLFQNRIIVDYTRSKGISTTAYSPLARGAVNSNATLLEIAAKHDASAGQIALAFLMAEGHVVIPSSSNKARIAENFTSQHLKLSDAEVATIRSIDEGLRLVNGAWCPVWDV